MTHKQLVAVIRRRMDALNMNPFRLHAELKGQVSKQTVYNFLLHGKALRTDILLLIMNLLDLTIIVNPTATKPSQRSIEP
jgi:hypothetical protein